MTTKLMEDAARVANAQIEIHISAPKEQVYRAWFDDIGSWFYENEETKVTNPTKIEEKLGGRCYMQLPDGGFNVLGEITMIKPNKKIRMRGDCTMPAAVIMNMTIAFEEVDGGTRVHIDHRMAGEICDGMAEEFEEGWMDGLQKLKKLIESN
ncbi:MAG: SRPBCC domain-containing protein [Phycisphaerales bacterium]|nr:SRPBCC domain-containing protein [Phycisphaerales bacterium]